MSKGVIGVSSAEAGRYSTFYASLFAMQRPDDTMVMFAASAVISQNRNGICDAALLADADWVLFLDDDHILRADTLTRLLDTNLDVISAHYTQRQPPFNPVLMSTELKNGTYLWKQLDPAESGIIEVAAAGAGCLLVRRKVLDALAKPYWTLGQINPESWGDDLHFCTRVRQAGFKIYCDLDNYVGHMMTGIIWPTREANKGWVANFARDPRQGTLSQWPMPLPGDV